MWHLLALHVLHSGSRKKQKKGIRVQKNIKQYLYIKEINVQQ